MRSPLRARLCACEQLSISHDGRRLAFVTSRCPNVRRRSKTSNIYLVNLTNDSAPQATPIRLTHNEAVELNLEWAPDNRHLVLSGQPRIAGTKV